MSRLHVVLCGLGSFYALRLVHQKEHGRSRERQRTEWTECGPACVAIESVHATGMRAVPVHLVSRAGLPSWYVKASCHLRYLDLLRYCVLRQ